MKVLELKNIMREEGQIFYLRKYACDAVFEFPTSTTEGKVMFSIETSPFGQKMVDFTLIPELNYPSMPIKKALTDFIIKEDNEGRLPC